MPSPPAARGRARGASRRARLRRPAAPRPSGDLPAPLNRLRRTRALLAALTHPSATGPQAPALRHLRLRLEFLGDALWNLAVIQWLLRDAGAPRADLAARKSRLAGGAFMAEVARGEGLGRALRIIPGPQAEALRAQPSVLAGTLEAVLAAWYLQAGLEPVLRYVGRILDRARRTEPRAPLLDAKSDLQQVITRLFRVLPSYRIVERSGSPHAPTFLVQVAADGRVLATGSGGSRRAAEQDAARRALEVLRAGRSPQAG